MTDVTVAAPDATTPVRTDEGRFAAGVSGNPLGRPKGRKNHLVNLQQDLEIAVREHISADKIKKILDKICSQAEGGNVAAAKLILDKVIANARESDDTSDNGRTVVFRIENATFAATNNKSQTPTIDVIDVTPIEVKT